MKLANIFGYKKPGFIKNLAIDLCILVLGLWGINKWQTRSLLPASSQQAAPVMILNDVDGFSHTIGQAADKESVIYFFAPWCSACRMTNGQFEEFKTHAAGQTAVYAVALDFESPGQIKSYMAEHGMSGPVLLGNEKVQEAYRVNSFPTFYFIDKSGFIKNTAIGFTTKWGLMWRSS